MGCVYLNNFGCGADYNYNIPTSANTEEVKWGSVKNYLRISYSVKLKQNFTELIKKEIELKYMKTKYAKNMWSYDRFN